MPLARSRSMCTTVEAANASATVAGRSGIRSAIMSFTAAAADAVASWSTIDFRIGDGTTSRGRSRWYISDNTSTSSRSSAAACRRVSP